jgi:TonB family protein
MEAVTETLVHRTRGTAGLNRMVVVSLGAHLVVAVAILLTPSASFEDRSPRTVMTISLGGAPGPRNGGMTPMGGRPIQAPPAEAPTRTPVTAPAPRAPQMTVPEPKARPLPKTPVQNPWDAKETKSTSPARAPQLPTPGSAVADTGARGIGFGLTTGGGGTGGYLDVGNFCCPEYLNTMLQLIQRNWNGQQQVAGETTMKFSIQRDGRLADVQVEKSSGYQALDLTAQRALLVTRQFPPLPAQYTDSDHLTVHLVFRYQR